MWEQVTVGEFGIGYQAMVSADEVSNESLGNGNFTGLLGLACESSAGWDQGCGRVEEAAASHLSVTSRLATAASCPATTGVEAPLTGASIGCAGAMQLQERVSFTPGVEGAI